MKIAVVGTGYVGLVTGTCFADSGNDVTCVDIDKAKIERLNRGQVPIYEPGLEEMLQYTIAAKRLRFTTDLPAAVKNAELVLMTVGTPQTANGSPDLSYLWSAVDEMAPHLSPKAIVCTKSTVPVGTNQAIFERLKNRTGRECDVASNPEFLKEGAAIEDFMKPDRVVVGVRRPEVAEVLKQLYAPFLRTEKPFVVMSPQSAEMTKYAANAMLATKISFINEMANLCERLGADINDVRRGIGHDSRIGFAFLFPGVGYGGSCFPKDIQAVSHLARQCEMEARVMEAVDAVNSRQKTILLEKIETHFGGDLKARKLAIWGLSFKPRTDDVREAPALALIDRLLTAGAKLTVFDPEATANVRAMYGNRLNYADEMYAAIAEAEALIIMTEWKDFQLPDFDTMRSSMKSRVFFAGRNLYRPLKFKAAGFTYHSIGRASVIHGENRS
jgi:UDPglucose 6-dehydrogenase